MTLVLNLATQAPYFYNNYSFTGFSSHGDRQFSCREDGVYELVGDADNDEPIEAHITTGMMDFGAYEPKSVTASYVGYSATDSVIFTANVEQASGDMEASYRLEAAANAPVMKRIKLGKGIKSRYWQFNVANTNGADFELETIDVLPIVLQRRVSP